MRDTSGAVEDDVVATSGHERVRVSVGGADLDLMSARSFRESIETKLFSERGKPLLVSFADFEHLYYFGLDSGQEGWFESRSRDADWLVLPESGRLFGAARRRSRISWDPILAVEAFSEVLGASVAAGARVGVVAEDSLSLTTLLVALADSFPELDISESRVVGPRDYDEVVSDTPDRGREAAGDEATPSVWLVFLPKPRGEQWLADPANVGGASLGLALGGSPSVLDYLGVPRRRRAGVLNAEGGIGGRLKRVHRSALGIVRLFNAGSSVESSMAKADVRAGSALGGYVLATPHMWRRRLRRFLLAADASVIAVSSLLAYLLRAALPAVFSLEPFQNEIPVALGVLPLWLVVLYGFGCYRPEVINSPAESLRRFGAASLVGALLLGFLSFALKLQLSRIYVGVFVGLVLALGTAMRTFVREYLNRQRSRGRFIQRVLMVGADEEAVDVALAMKRVPTAGYRVVGFMDDRLEPGSLVAGEFEVLGPLSETLKKAAETRAGLAVVSPTAVPPGTLRQLIVALEGSPIDIAVAPSLFEVVTRRVSIEPVGTVNLLHVDQIRLVGLRALAKRTLDVVAAVALFVVTAPIMVGCALAILLSDGPPILFRQRRVGKDGRPFVIYKFRTMLPGAEHDQSELEDRNEAGHILFKIKDDPRITPVGKILRRWSADELPQLWNVLKGEMSMVGPRPALPEEVDKYEPWHLRRLRVRPGITGIWQVSGRSSVPFDEAVRMDLFYIENWSLGLDLVLLARTVAAVLSRRGAY